MEDNKTGLVEIRFKVSEDDSKLIDKRAKELGITKATFCKLTILYLLKSEIELKITPAKD